MKKDLNDLKRGNSKRNFYGALRSGRNDFQSKFIGATGTSKKKKEKKNEKGDTKAAAITASVLSVLPDVLFILVTMSAVTSVIVRYGSTTDCKSFSF